MEFEIYKGDIVSLEVDAIVNAANTSLLGGGGVDGAIHRAAGPGLLEECKKLNGCETGKAKITSAYNLRVKYIIHTVGPVWNGGNNSERELLSDCYKNSLALAETKCIKSIAFPNISTGVYGFPKQEAAEIAIQTLRKYSSDISTLKKIVFAVFDDENFKI